MRGVLSKYCENVAGCTTDAAHAARCGGWDTPRSCLSAEHSLLSRAAAELGRGGLGVTAADEATVPRGDSPQGNAPPGDGPTRQRRSRRRPGLRWSLRSVALPAVESPQLKAGALRQRLHHGARAGPKKKQKAKPKKKKKLALSDDEEYDEDWSE